MKLLRKHFYVLWLSLKYTFGHLGSLMEHKLTTEFNLNERRVEKQSTLWEFVVICLLLVMDKTNYHIYVYRPLRSSR